MKYKNIYEISKILPEEETRTFTILLNKKWDYVKVTHNISKGFGWINIMSSYGDYSYIWNAMGDNCDLPKFFMKADKYYLANKLFGAEQTEFCIDKAVKDLKKDICKDRREGNISKKQARDVFDFIEEELHCHMSPEKFGDAMNESDAINNWYPEWWDSDFGIRYKSRYLVLQDEIIPMLQEYFEGTLKEGRLD